MNEEREFLPSPGGKRRPQKRSGPFGDAMPFKLRALIGFCALCLIGSLGFLVARSVAPRKPAVPQSVIEERERVASEYEAALADLETFKPQPGMETPEQSRQRTEEAELKEADAIDESKIHLETQREILKLELSDIEPRELKRQIQRLQRDADKDINNGKMARGAASFDKAQSQLRTIMAKNAAHKKAAERVARLRDELEHIDRQISDH